MRKFGGLTAAFVGLAVALLVSQEGQVLGQAGGSGGQGGYQTPGAPSSNMPSTPEQSDQQRFFRDNVFSARNAASKATAAQKATATQEVTAVLASTSFACKPADAAQVAAGPETIGGKTVDTKTYEIACDGGLGYFLIAQSPEKPTGFSCFAADAARAADVAQGRKPGISCSLPANADLKAMATSALARQGKTCQVHDIRWMGQNAKAGTEFTEIACTDGAGYVLKLLQPAMAGQAMVFTCADATKQGLPCKLTNAPTATITVQTFKDALSQHGIACDATNVRVIGKQNTSKRHVVEFQCPQQPKGLVALIPLSDSTAPFQTMDCAAAAKQKIGCTLTTVQ
jgi:hypothetical protein